MREHNSVTGLRLDVAGALPAVGDRRTVAGSARLVLDDAYEMEFAPGDQVEWRFELRRIAGGLEITGNIAGVVTMACYRCLETFEFPISVSAREHALWLSEADAAEGEEPASEYAVEGGEFDLEPVMRDSIALSLPVSRVCDEACRGLCLKCGANLNTEPCGCDTGRVDARLKPLEALRKRLEDAGPDAGDRT